MGPQELPCPPAVFTQASGILQENFRIGTMAIAYLPPFPAESITRTLTPCLAAPRGKAEKPKPLCLHQNQTGEKWEQSLVSGCYLCKWQVGTAAALLSPMLGEATSEGNSKSASFSFLLRAQDWLSDVLLTSTRGISIHRLCHSLHCCRMNLKARNEKS